MYIRKFYKLPDTRVRRHSPPRNSIDTRARATGWVFFRNDHPFLPLPPPIARTRKASREARLQSPISLQEKKKRKKRTFFRDEKNSRSAAGYTLLFFVLAWSELQKKSCVIASCCIIPKTPTIYKSSRFNVHHRRYIIVVNRCWCNIPIDVQV